MTSGATGEPEGADGDPVVAAGCPVAPGGYDAPPVPLGPDSLTWKYFGDWRGMLQGPWAGSMQNMHPQLGAAVEQHSMFFMERVAAATQVAVPDRWRRLRRGPRPSDRVPKCATTTSPSRGWTLRAAGTTR